MAFNFNLLFLLAVVLTLVTPSYTEECSIEPADVIFVLDTSYSIWPPDFYKEVAFMEKVVDTFNIGPGDSQTRVGALTFGHKVWPKFYLNSYMDLPTMKQVIRNIKYGEGKTTNTGDALSYTRNHMLSARAGARENTTKIVVVVSDGRSQKTWFTANMAQLMQESGIHLFAISVGFRLDHNELAAIASDPDEQYYFSIDKYSDMSYIKRSMEEKICNTFTDNAEAWNITDNTAEFKGKEEDVLVLNCQDKMADIYFLLDASYSINTDNFASEMEFIQGVVDILDIGPNKTRVGLVTFSDEANFHIKLEQDLSKDNFVTYSNTAKYIGGGTDTGNALRLLREKGFFGEMADQREGAAKVVIVLTDGLSISPDSTAREAKLLKNAGVQMFSIGIGAGVDKQELEDIASEPTDRFLFHVDDFGALDSIKMMLAARTCTVKTDQFGLNIPGIVADNAVCHPSHETDLLFIYDALELGSWRSQAVSQFISKTMADFNLATDKLRVGREVENCPAGNVPLGSALQASDLDSITYRTFTDLLKRVQRTRFSPENGGRHGAYKMAVLIVDPEQRMNFDTYIAAKALQDSLDFFYVVSIGENMYTSRLMGLAGDRYSMNVKNYDELPKLADQLMGAICDFFFR